MKVSKGDVVVIMDGDLQDPPEELPRFFGKMERRVSRLFMQLERIERKYFSKKISYKIFYRYCL